METGPLFGSVCSKMALSGQTRVTVLSDTGNTLSQTMMDPVYCTTLPIITGGTDRAGSSFLFSATTVWKSVFKAI